MSQENVEIVRRSYDAYRRGDFDEAMADAHPDIEWNPYEAASMVGLDAVRTYLRRWGADWAELETTPEDFIDAGDRVIAVVHFRGRGRGSGVEVDARSYAVYTLREGKAIRMDEFVDLSEARAAAGLSE